MERSDKYEKIYKMLIEVNEILGNKEEEEKKEEEDKLCSDRVSVILQEGGKEGLKIRELIEYKRKLEKVTELRKKLERKEEMSVKLEKEKEEIEKEEIKMEKKWKETMKNMILYDEMVESKEKMYSNDIETVLEIEMVDKIIEIKKKKLDIKMRMSYCEAIGEKIKIDEIEKEIKEYKERFK